MPKRQPIRPISYEWIPRVSIIQRIADFQNPKCKSGRMNGIRPAEKFRRPVQLRLKRNRCRPADKKPHNEQPRQPFNLPESLLAIHETDLFQKTNLRTASNTVSK